MDRFYHKRLQELVEKLRNGRLDMKEDKECMVMAYASAEEGKDLVGMFGSAHAVGHMLGSMAENDPGFRVALMTAAAKLMMDDEFKEATLRFVELMKAGLKEREGENNETFAG